MTNDNSNFFPFKIAECGDTSEIQVRLDFSGRGWWTHGRDNGSSTGPAQRLEKVLSTVDGQGLLGPRLKGDAARLWQRTGKMIAMKLIGQQVDADALELACYALQLPPVKERD